MTDKQKQINEAYKQRNVEKSPKLTYTLKDQLKQWKETQAQTQRR
jgi:gas vesicle protein